MGAALQPGSNTWYRSIHLCNDLWYLCFFHQKMSGFMRWGGSRIVKNYWWNMLKPSTTNESNTYWYVLYRNSLTQSWKLPWNPSLFPKKLNNRTLMQRCHLRPAATSRDPQVRVEEAWATPQWCINCIGTWVTTVRLTCKMKMQWFSLKSSEQRCFGGMFGSYILT